jgi:hypothetical protein
MAKSGQVVSVLEVVQQLTAVSTKLQQVLNSTIAAAIYRIVATLGFGVPLTKVMVMVL